MERLDKFLCDSGVGTRSQVKNILKAGRVQVDGIVERMWEEIGEKSYVVATGGMAKLFYDESKCIDKLDGLLTLKGLRLIYERNRKDGEGAK